MMVSLTDKYDVVKDIGDGSFGSVVLAKVKSTGSGVARKGSVVSVFVGHLLVINLRSRLPSKP